MCLISIFRPLFHSSLLTAISGLSTPMRVTLSADLPWGGRCDTAAHWTLFLARALNDVVVGFLFLFFCFFSFFVFKLTFKLASSWRRLKGQSGASVHASQARVQFIWRGMLDAQPFANGRAGPYERTCRAIRTDVQGLANGREGPRVGRRSAMGMAGRGASLWGTKRDAGTGSRGALCLCVLWGCRLSPEGRSGLRGGAQTSVPRMRRALT